MIKIYDINGDVLMQAQVTSAAVRVQELSKSDYIQLSFSTAKKIILPVGAYIEHTYKIDKVREVTRKFLLLESYEPTQSTESSWKYTPEFQHPKMVLSKTPFYISTYNSQKEKIKQNIWSFVGTTSVLSGKIADFLNKDIKFGNCGWVCDMTTVTANTVNVSFSDNDFISALSAIANAIGDNCEWHIDYENETVYIGKIVLGDDSEVLEVGKNVGVPSVTSSRESYYNAFSVFGGTRNITQKNEKDENVSSGDIRLQLSTGTGSIQIDGKERTFTIDEFSTIDLRKDKEKEPLFTKVLDFSDIFPSLNTYVYDVRGREKYVLDDNGKKIPVEYNSDGSVKTYKTFTVWYMRLAYPTTEKISGKTIINTTVDDGVTHYWYDFEITDDLLINGKNIGCSFEANFADKALSTPLAGRGTNGDYVGFELTYHNKDVSDRTSDDVSEEKFNVKTGDYEIIYQEDNNVIIPSNTESMLIPRGEDKPSLKCNITVLYNIAMNESLYKKDAQDRLLDAAKKEIIRSLSDLNNYSFKSYPQVFAKENPCLQIAQAITYKDGNGYSLESRVLKLETNLDYNFVQTITVGNQTIKGTTTQLREDVQKIIASGGNSGEGSGGYTVSQLSNLISRYGTRYFLSKIYDDIAQGFITFTKGLQSNEVAKLVGGATFGNNGYHFDTSGNLILDTLSSLDFDEALEKGFGFTKNSLGKYTLSLHNLIVWGKAVFNELEIRKLSHVGGNVVLSAAASKIVYVEEIPDTDGSVSGWKCYILADDGTTQTTNGWVVNDQAKCQQFNIKEGVYKNVSNRYYWRAVTRVSTEAVTIPGKREVKDEEGNTKTEYYDLYDGKKFHWVILSKSNCEASTNDAPAANDTIVLDGHQLHKDSDASLTERTNLMMLETTGTGVPRIVALTGVTDFKHETSNEVFILSPSKVTFVSQYFEFRSASGNAIKLINNRGAWVDGEKYYYYDQVIYENAYWTCIVSGDNAYTTEKPSADSKVWRKDLEIGESVKVESTEVVYAYSDGTETPPIQPSDSEFAYTNIQDALAKMDIGDYLWSRTTVAYTDGNSSVTYSVSRMGADGENGKKGADGLTTHFAYAEGIVFGDDGKATGVSGTFSTTLFNGAQYIGTYTDDKLEDSTDFKAYDWTKLKGERGDKGDQGDKGDDAVVYSVITSYATSYISSTLAYGIRVYFRKTTGDDFENVTLKSDNSNGYCQVYVDGSFNANITNYLNSGNNFIDYSAHSDAIKPDSKIRIDWYSKDAALLAMGTYSVAGGNVIAYCNSDSKPSKPTSTDTSSLGGGWSLTPKSGGTYTSFSNVSYGSFSDSGGNSTAWSDESEDGYTWKKSPSGLSNSYGWALMKVSFETNTDNVDIEIALKAYSEENWDYIQVYALDTEASITAGSDYLNGGVKKISGNGKSASYTYNVAKAGSHFFYVAYAKDSSGSSNGDYGLFRIASNPTTVTISSTVWMSKADVKDGRVQLPWSEPVKVTGENGEGALEIIVSPDTLIFDSDENGLASDSVASAKSATISCYRDGVKVTNITYTKGLELNCKASVTSSNGTATIKLNSIDTQSVSANGSTATVSQASGSVSLTAYDPKTKLYHQVQVNFQVNVSKFTGSFSLSNKQLSSKFSELTNKGNGESITSLTDYKSEILQTAREISLKVSELAVGRRNMLPGSAFRKGDDGFEVAIYGDFDGSTYTKGYHGNQGIFKNGGVSGSNFFRAKSYYDGSEQQYTGLFWRGGGASKNIKVQANKKYALSCWVKCDRTDAIIALETIYKASETTTTRQGRPSSTTNSFQVSKANTWQLISCIVTTDGSYNYLEVNFWVSHMMKGVTATACFCHPMFEEAEEYNGWTLSELDYDYVGGNLIDNSRTFASGGNCYTQTRYGSVIANGYNNESSVFKARMEALAGSVSSKYSLPSSVSSGTRYALSSDWTVWEYNGNSLSDDSHYNGWQKTNESLHQDVFVVNQNLELNKDYIISWYAKCEGKGLFGAYAAGTGKTVYSEYSDGGIDQSTYGENSFLLTTQWKRFWMHVKLIKGSCSVIAFRQYRGDVSSANSAMTVYFTQPKIEEGATVTDWTEKRTDMVDKQALLETGIDIANKKITLTADKTYVQSNSGSPIALFSDTDGYLNTALLNVQHVYLKNGSTTYGHFGLVDAVGGTASDGKKYPLWIGSSTCQDATFAVSEDGEIVATKGKVGPLTIDKIGLYSYPLNINSVLRKGADFRLGGFWISQDMNDCNNELIVGNRCWWDPLDNSKNNYYTTTLLGSAQTNHASVIVAKKWNGATTGDSRTDPSVPALLVESKGVGITSFGLNYLGGMAMGCIRASAITGDTLEAMNLNRISMVVMTNTGSYTFPLPKSPVAGQILLVIQRGAKLSFSTSGKTIYWGGNVRNDTTKFESNTTGQFNMFFYDGYYWHVHLIK